MKCRDIKRLVPRALMREGINLCKTNIADYLKDTKIIAEEGKLYHAVISAEFAVEELGKLLLLKETMEKEASDPIVIDGMEFCSHNKKVKRALKFLDPQNKYRILFSGIWERGVWASDVWSGETEISSPTRLECAFVDFLDNHWTVGRDINPTYLKEFITNFEEKLATRMIFEGKKNRRRLYSSRLNSD
jgi:AbiV family abortive infection protein